MQKRSPVDFYARAGKRVLDVTLAAVLLLGFLPVIAALVILVRVRLGSPVLFRQCRPGKHERIFEVIKFRTMLVQQEQAGKRLSDTERLTPLGRFLRAASLDELPQLINVLRGEMSFVGPRPLLPEYLPLYSPEERLRHTVRPGITGLAQINGRNTLEAHARLRMDVEYARNVSFALDLRVLIGTVGTVLTRKGVEVCAGDADNSFLERQGRPAPKNLEVSR